MDEETLAKATDPFFTTKGVGKGTGLGLSMVHGLATQSNGLFRLTSEPGQGTLAEIYLPVAEGAPAGASAAEAATSEVDADGLPKLTVLAVDDDALVLFGTVALLEDLGHEVIEAANEYRDGPWQRAYDLLQEFPDEPNYQEQFDNREFILQQYIELMNDLREVRMFVEVNR